MTTRKVRRAVTASMLVAVSCNVYSPSLLVGHGGASGSDTGATGGTSGTSGAGAGAGGTNVAGTNAGGSSGNGAGGTAGRASGGTAGRASGGSGNETSGGGGEGGEAGAPPGEGGSAGIGGTAGGVSGGGGSAGTGGTAGAAAGTGGSAGTGEVAGMGGTAGTSAGTAGIGGAVGGAGMGGAGGAPASGCANLTVPLAAAADKAHFVITLTNAANMSAAATTISMRVYVLAGSGGVLVNYVQDTNNRFMPATTARPAISTLVGVWTTVTWNVGAETAVNSIDKANIKRIGIEVTANNSTSLTNPTKIYIDSVSTSVITPVPSFPFDTSTSVVTTPSNGVDVGGQVLWFNSNTSDTSASGVTLGWLTSCP